MKEGVELIERIEHMLHDHRVLLLSGKKPGHKLVQSEPRVGDVLRLLHYILPNHFPNEKLVLEILQFSDQSLESLQGFQPLLREIKEFEEFDARLVVVEEFGVKLLLPRDAGSVAFLRVLFGKAFDLGLELPQDLPFYKLETHFLKK